MTADLSQQGSLKFGDTLLLQVGEPTQPSGYVYSELSRYMLLLHAAPRLRLSITLVSFPYCSSAYNRVSVFPVDQADSEKGPCFPNVACKSSPLICTALHVVHVPRVARVSAAAVSHCFAYTNAAHVQHYNFPFFSHYIVATFKVIDPNYNPVHQEYNLLQQEKY